MCARTDSAHARKAPGWLMRRTLGPRRARRAPARKQADHAAHRCSKQRSGQRRGRARMARARTLTRRPRAWRGLRETRSAPHIKAPRGRPRPKQSVARKTKDTDSAARRAWTWPRTATLVVPSWLGSPARTFVCRHAPLRCKTRAQSATRAGRSGGRARKSPRQPPPQARPRTRLLAKSSRVVHALDTHGHAQPYPRRVLVHALHGRSPRSSRPGRAHSHEQTPTPELHVQAASCPWRQPSSPPCIISHLGACDAYAHGPETAEHRPRPATTPCTGCRCALISMAYRAHEGGRREGPPAGPGPAARPRQIACHARRP